MAVTNLALAAYPVGSIYMSVSSTSPATLFGGTWERITGRFLLAATDGGSTGTNVQSTASAAPGASGGEAMHKLVENEMPKHYHPVKWGSAAGSSLAITPESGNLQVLNLTAWEWLSNKIENIFAGYKGGDGAHNNMPPFLAVYVWMRTA